MTVKTSLRRYTRESHLLDQCTRIYIPRIYVEGLNVSMCICWGLKCLEVKLSRVEFVVKRFRAEMFEVMLYGWLFGKCALIGNDSLKFQLNYQYS